MAEAGPELAARAAQIQDAALPAGDALHVVAFGGRVRAVASGRGADMDTWRARLRAPAGDVETSCGAALADLPAVERLVIVTDGWENRAPRLVDALPAYIHRVGRAPSIHLMQPAGSGWQLASDLKRAQVPAEVFIADPALAGLAALPASLAGAGGEDLFEQILRTPIG